MFSCTLLLTATVCFAGKRQPLLFYAFAAIATPILMLMACADADIFDFRYATSPPFYAMPMPPCCCCQAR